MGEPNVTSNPNLDYIPEGAEPQGNKSGFTRHPVFDYIPDGDEGKKMAAVVGMKSAPVEHIGDTAFESDKFCPICREGFPDRKELEKHYKESHPKEKVPEIAKPEPIISRPAGQVNLEDMDLNTLKELALIKAGKSAEVAVKLKPLLAGKGGKYVDSVTKEQILKAMTVKEDKGKK